jgi:hypothetical protein
MQMARVARGTHGTPVAMFTLFKLGVSRMETLSLGYGKPHCMKNLTLFYEIIYQNACRIQIFFVPLQL